MMRTRTRQLGCVLSFLIVAAALYAKVDSLDLTGLSKKLASTDYEVRKGAIKQLLYAGQKRPLTKEEIEVLLPPFKSDPDWRIKVRITAVLPFAADKDLVLQSLIKALQERDVDASGGGNLQSYSCKALAIIGDPKALPAMRDWLNYLKTHPDTFKLLRESCIKQAEKYIRELEEKAKRKGSKALQRTR